MNLVTKMLHEYANKGLHVHPLRDLEKTPRLSGWQEKSTTDIRTINGWYQAFPNANYGIQTGSISNVWVLDIDVKKGKDGLASLKELCPQFDLETIGAPVVRTPTGGFHVYFRYPANSTIRNRTDVLEGIDVRGDGGYVVAPPSILVVDGDDKEYEWISGDISETEIKDAPSYLIELVLGKTKKDVSDVSSASSSNSKGGGNFPDTSGVSEGSRDDYIFRLIAQCKGRGMDKDEVTMHALEAAENCSPPFDDDSVFEKIDRIYSDDSYSSKVSTESPEEKCVREFNSKYAVVMAGSSTVVLDEGRVGNSDSINECLQSFTDFKNFHSNKKIQLADGDKTKPVNSAVYWLQHPDRRSYSGIVFDPSDQHREDEYNFWTGFPITPAQGNCSKFWEYLREVICAGDRDSYTYVRKWIAHIFQKPYELSGTSIVITGKQGVGKSTLTKILSKLLHKQELS